jgi:L-lactate dehydrogenase complex protein LldG
VADVSAVVLAIARAQSARSVVTWDAASLGLDLRPSLASAGLDVASVAPGDVGDGVRGRHRGEAASADIGVTGVDIALAETGTMILVSGAGRPRSTSLLPPTHVAVFDRRRLVESLEQVGIVLEALHADPARTMSGAVINFITGPSRTADIELTLTRGVHGPKAVHAVFVDEPLGESGA